MKQNRNNAVSPVVGVMLMLVVTIIIAAIVSAFSAGAVNGQTKAPQATIQGQFSVANGLSLTHAGGDPLPLSNIRIVVRNDATFGPNVEQTSANIVNLNNFTDQNGNTLTATSFNAGDTIYLNATNCACSTLQPYQNANAPILHPELNKRGKDVYS